MAACWSWSISCYEAQLGNIETAKRRLACAFRKDADYRQLALDDSDLEPLWEHIRSIE
jgi:hypothetical protein